MNQTFTATLYHGTSWDFTDYSEDHLGKTTDPGWYGAGLSLTPNFGIAQGYADFSASQTGSPARVMTVSVTLNKPFYTQSGAIEFSTAFEKAVGRETPANPREITAILKKSGFDGVVVLKKNGNVSEVTLFEKS